MKKYNRDLISKYINGEEIIDYNIEELEDDKDFMMQVISISNDYNFYNLCSDKVKLDYDFIKYLILKFKNNINFICDVANEYIEKTEDDFARTELALIMRDLTKNNEEVNMEYKVLTETIYSGKRLEIELCKAKENDEQFSSEIGMGFWFIFDLYNGSDIILNFYAGKIIKDVFLEYDLNLEDILHNCFRTKEQVNAMGINNFMVKFIEQYDPMLASYLSANIGYLSDFKEDIQKIQNNWDKYNRNKEAEKYCEAIEKSYEYMEEADSVMGVVSTIYYVANELGINEKIKKYDIGMTQEFYEDIMSELNEPLVEGMEEDFTTATINSNLEERKHYINVKRILTGIIFGNGSYQLIGDKTDKKKVTGKGKILKLDLKKITINKEQ